MEISDAQTGTETIKLSRKRSRARLWQNTRAPRPAWREVAEQIAATSLPEIKREHGSSIDMPRGSPGDAGAFDGSVYALRADERQRAKLILWSAHNYPR